MEYNPLVITALLFILGGLLIMYVLKNVGRKHSVQGGANIAVAAIRNILNAHVTFYRQLNEHEQNRFCERVGYFLKTTKISAEKGVFIADEDKVLVAASATIPLFHFDNWAYENLDEVLIYPDAFDEKFDTDDANRNILGMVGDGAMNRKMILSLGALRTGFALGSSHNTAIHEFVHLIDKADGEIDGVPEYLIPKSLVGPWLAEMSKTIRQIRSEQSDIRDYAATNEAEFLAVLSEYFFQKPKLLKEEHPELFKILSETYERSGTI